MRQKDSGIVRSRQGKSVFEGTVRGFRKVGSDENPGERGAQVRGRPRLDLLVDLMFLNHCCPLVADARARPGETMCLRTQIPVMPSTRQRAQTGPVQIGERFRGGVQAACIRLRSSYFGRVKGRRISTTLRLMLAMARPGSISTGSAIVRKRTFQWLRLFLRMNAPLLGLFFVTDRFSPNGHLLRRDPDFDTALLEASNIKADQERIIGTAQTEAQFASYFRLRLSPTFEFMPAHSAAPFKDLVGATADGLLDSAGLLHPTEKILTVLVAGPC